MTPDDKTVVSNDRAIAAGGSPGAPGPDLSTDEDLRTAVTHLVAHCRSFLLELDAMRREIEGLGDPRTTAVLDELDAAASAGSPQGSLRALERQATDLLRRVR